MSKKVSTKVANTKERVKLQDVSKVENYVHSRTQKTNTRKKTEDEQFELQTFSNSKVSGNNSKQKKSNVSQKEVSINPQVLSRISKSKSNNYKSLSVLSTSEKNIASYKADDKDVKKSHLAYNVVETKPTRKYQITYSEKRGLSTIHVPKSNIVGHSSKQTGNATKTIVNKTISKNTESTDKNNLSSKVRRKSRTLSSSEVKVLNSIAYQEHSTQNVHKSKGVKTSIMPKDTTHEDIDDNYYADDFEDYESDFEEYTDDEILEVSQSSNESEINLYKGPIELSAKEQQKVICTVNNHKTEEEDMHDSGHYELAEAKRRALMIESITTKAQNISSPLLEFQQINKENNIHLINEDKLFENKSLPLSMDEGFEDTKSGDFTKLPLLSQVAFIDFSKTKDCSSKKLVSIKNPIKPKCRGSQLLTMIKLNTSSFSLFECAPVPYEEFITNYGKLHSQQMYTQTGNDRLEAETQTVEISHVNKWTQFPISCRQHGSNKDLNSFIMEQAGVGSDDNPNIENVITMPLYDILQLNHFVRRAATVTLSLLEERKFGGTIFQNDEQEISITDGFVKFDTESIEFLAGREVIMIQHSESINKILLTIHAPYEEEIEILNKQKDITDYCLGCVWNICEPSLPIKLFYSTCLVTACCFHSTNNNIVFAGLEDGSISLWDLKENEMWHHKVTNNINGNDWIIRTPTYTTSANISTHDSKIIAIHALFKTEETYTSKNKFLSTQLCSIDENGHFVTWSMFYNLESNVNDLGLSQWGNIRLMKSQNMLIHMSNNGTLIDMRVDNVDSTGLFVATESGEVLHTTCFGCKVNPLVYKRNRIAPCGNTTYIETCSFKVSYFLIGCDDGTILVYSSNREKPILQLKHDNCTNKIAVLQWSKLKPSMVYVLNNKSQIYTHNIESNKIHYISTPSLEKRGYINCMQLCSWKSEHDKATQYLVLGTNIGTVLVYKLKKEFYCSDKTEMEQELFAFIKYIELL